MDIVLVEIGMLCKLFGPDWPDTLAWREWLAHATVDRRQRGSII